MAPPRRTMARQRIKAPRAPWLIPLALITTLILLASGAVLGLTTFSPRQIECITSEHTYCRQDIQDSLQDVKNIRFFFPGKTLRNKEEQLRQDYPDLAQVQLQRTFTGTVLATITLARPLITLQLNGQWVLIRENGYLSPAPPIDGQLAVELTATLSGQQLVEPWGRVEQKNLAQLADAVMHFRPRIKKITAVEPTKVIMHPENNGPIFVRVDDRADVPAQLSTLQAFFRSTTMDKPYQELDVRFSHLVIKE